MWRGTSTQKAMRHLQWKNYTQHFVHWKDNFIIYPISSTNQESHFHGVFFPTCGHQRGAADDRCGMPSFEKWKIWKKGKKRSASIQKACDI